MRMYLYEQAFGYTFLRLMVYVILITEAILMIPTIMYIFNQKIKLIKPYFIIILTMYIIINFIKIDEMIAKRNVDSFLENPNNRNIDLGYLYTLSVDSIPEIERLLWINNNNGDEKKIQRIKESVNHQLYYERLNGRIEKMTWQSFNINRYMVEKNLEILELEP